MRNCSKRSTRSVSVLSSVQAGASPILFARFCITVILLAAFVQLKASVAAFGVTNTKSTSPARC